MPAAAPVALVHDYLLVRRGAERTFEAIAECWPEAPIYTLLYDREGSEERFADRDVRVSPLQRLGSSQSGFRRLLPVYPLAVRRLPVAGHRLIVSSSSAFAHGVRPDAGARHVCYCHSPFRYAWFERGRARAELPAPLRPALAGALAGIRFADRSAARRVAGYIANSELTRNRIATHWGRDSTVLHPPVEVDRFPSPPARPKKESRERRPLLVVCELVAHKRVDVALEAARRAGVPIRVVGEGPERERLEARFGAAPFRGRLSDAELDRLYANALALVLPNVEEFGIAAVEAQAAGRPVLAAGAGGALETVVAGETGLFFAPGDVDALTALIAATDFDRFDAARIARHARRFSRDSFQRALRERVEAIAAARPGPSIGSAPYAVAAPSTES